MRQGDILCWRALLVALAIIVSGVSCQRSHGNIEDEGSVRGWDAHASPSVSPGGLDGMGSDPGEMGGIEEEWDPDRVVAPPSDVTFPCKGSPLFDRGADGVAEGVCALLGVSCRPAGVEVPSVVPGAFK